LNETIAQMQQRLATLQPESLDILDDSAKHAGHAGAASGGGHYQLTIVSKQFAGKPQVARHRLIYQALGDMMQRQIHALSIAAYTPDQL
jgi:BolA family transcriptional regulator, general stress-responsive regulator